MPSEYQIRRAEHDRLRALAHEREFFHDVSDVAKHMSMNVGISPGQATIVVLHDGKEHGTIGAVHVAISEDGKIVIAPEAGPDDEIEIRRVVRRPKWRFYDFWRWDPEKHDNSLRSESEWPVLRKSPRSHFWQASSVTGRGPPV